MFSKLNEGFSKSEVVIRKEILFIEFHERFTENGGSTMSKSSVEEKPFLLNFLGFVEVILNSLLTLNRLGGGAFGAPPLPRKCLKKGKKNEKIFFLF